MHSNGEYCTYMELPRQTYEDHGDNAHCYLDMQICKLYFLHVQMPVAIPRALTAYSCTIQHHIGKSLGVSRICTYLLNATNVRLSRRVAVHVLRRRFIAC